MSAGTSSARIRTRFPCRWQFCCSFVPVIGLEQHEPDVVLSGQIFAAAADHGARRASGDVAVGPLSSQATLTLPAGRRASLTLSARAAYANLLYSRWLKVDGEELSYFFHDYNLTLTLRPNERNLVWLEAYYGGDDAGYAGGDMAKVNGDSIFPVLNMLNARYFIMPLNDGRTVPLQNPYVHGPAWFVDKVTYVDNANQEIDKVGKIDLRHEAVADKRFKEQLKSAVRQTGESVVRLTSYMSNKLTYDVSSAKGGVIVFSEVYYPGWTATVDGQEAELGRVNYLLRALNIAPGSHKVELTFHPASVTTTETIAYAAYAVLVLLIAFVVYMEYKKKKTH